jgi:hypothetical protein
MYDEDGNWISDGDEGANYYSYNYPDYGNTETYGGYDQQQQDALQAAIDAAKNDKDAADLNTVLGGSGDATADENAATSINNNATALQNEITDTKQLDSPTKVYTMANGTKFIHN